MTKEKKKMPLTEAETREVGAKYHAKLRLLKLGLKERTKVRRRKEDDRRRRYYK